MAKRRSSSDPLFDPQRQAFLVMWTTNEGYPRIGSTFANSVYHARKKGQQAIDARGVGHVTGVKKLSKQDAADLVKLGRVGVAKTNPRSRYSTAARRFVGRKIRRLAKEGYRGKQRVAIALSSARRRRLKVPGRRNPILPSNIVTSERKAWERVAVMAARLTGNEVLQDSLIRLAQSMLAQLSHGVHANPATLAIVGANPPGRLLGEIVGDVKYHRTIGKYPGFYKHDFKGRSKACIYAMPDGSLRIIGKGR